MQMNFYHYAERLVCVGGWSDEEMERIRDERVEIFEIGEDEQLIGCKLHSENVWGEDFFLEVTWLKMKVRF